MGGHGWGIVHAQELIAAVQAALDQGINFFDTADTYGLGQSERTLGQALGSRRHEAVIGSKFGVRVGENGTVYDNSPEWIRTACENSLRRLNTDYIDLYQIHYRDGKTPLADVVGALEELRAEGKIRHFGFCNLTVKDLNDLQAYKGKFCTLQNQYSLARRDLEEDIRTLSKELDLTPLTWGSLGQGILTGKYERSATFGSDERRSRKVYVNFHGDKLLKNLEIVEKMREVAKHYNQPLSALAVRIILDYLPGSVVLCGAKRPAQILESAESLGWKLDPEHINALELASR